MSSFSCPHFDLANDYCLRLRTDCVPGRKGCVLRGNCGFLIPAEVRVRMLEEERKHRPALTWPQNGEGDPKP